MAKSAKLEEPTPIEITLGNLLKLFVKNQKNHAVSKNTVHDRVLLGDACRYLYGNISQETVSFTKIRNCVTRKQDETYPQAYNQYKEIAAHYFPDPKQYDPVSPSDEQDEQEKLKQLESQKAEVNALRLHILRAWKQRLLTPLPDYESLIDTYLSDHTLNTSELLVITQIRSFLKEYKKSAKSEDQAEVFTVLTFLAMTRGCWDSLPASILPESYKTREHLHGASDLEIRYQEAAVLYTEGNYQEALKKLEDLKNPNAFQGKVALLQSKVRRQLLRSSDLTHEAREEITSALRSDLANAIKFHNTQAMLIVAREYDEVQPDSIFTPNKEACIHLCKELLTSYPEAPECGEAAWRLYQLVEDPAQAEQYLETAYKYSYEQAVKLYKEKHAVSLTCSINQASLAGTGCYSINDDNVYSEFIRQSAPCEWTMVNYPIKGISFCSNHTEVWKEIKKHAGNQKFFLISNDFERNLQELLHLLQSIKSHFGADHAASLLTEIPFEFYIRGDEEKIGPFVDTALARIENMIIPVHIIDDEKQASRFLAQHPLFYPIRRLGENEEALLKFVIVGGSKACEWMAREASWMLTFRNPRIQTEIILIGPDADDVKDRIQYLCPDSKLVNLKLKAEKCGYETTAFQKTIDETLDNGYSYFAIDIGSDIDNMAMATRIREYCVRKKLRNASDDIAEQPVIAFRCQNPDLANLSLGTIVVNEDFGKNWFNNYKVIPFGRIDQQYHWDSLTNHILEQLSLNIHLQYYLKEDPDLEIDSRTNTDPDTETSIPLKDHPAIKSAAEENRSNYFQALRDYYGRSYNRDSSMAVAMSLPYRLYQGIVDQRRILPPEPINILDADTFYSAETRALLAGWVQKLNWEHSNYTRIVQRRVQDSFGNLKDVDEIELDADTEVYQVADWEQQRWNRFMISRKWVSASIEQMKTYYNNGNHRQQLYIGKMHPCIKEFEKLPSINKQYTKLASKDKGLHMSNITAIQRTEKLLTLYWVQKARALFEKDTDQNTTRQER